MPFEVFQVFNSHAIHRMLSRAALLLVLIISSLVWPSKLNAAPKWKEVGFNGDIPVFIDLNSIVRDGSFITAWFRWRLPEPITLKQVGITYRSNLMQYTYFCEKRTGYLVQAELYEDAAFQKHVLSQSEKGTPVPRNIVPGSIEEAMFSNACSRNRGR